MAQMSDAHSSPLKTQLSHRSSGQRPLPCILLLCCPPRMTGWMGGEERAPDGKCCVRLMFFFFCNKVDDIAWLVLYSTLVYEDLTVGKSI